MPGAQLRAGSPGHCPHPLCCGLRYAPFWTAPEPLLAALTAGAIC